jgi:hypothetical protein
MIKIVFMLVGMLIFSDWAVAQSKLTFDLATFNPPAGWKKENKEGVMLFTSTNQQSGYCVIGVYRSKESAGNINSDFNSEWQEVVVKPFKVTAAPNTEAAQEQDGWKILAGSANFTDGAGTAAVMLTTVSGYGRALSILVLVNDQSYMPVVEKFLDSVTFTKPLASGSSRQNPTPQAGGGSENKLVGNWGKSASSPWGLSPGAVVTNVGYYKIQYHLKADGTYTFKGESWGGYLRSQEFWTIEESGVYTVRGDSLTITPRASKATLRNRDGVIQKSQNNPLEPMAYRWGFHYFEGLNETQLVLQPSRQTNRDGGFGGNSSFPNSYLFSQNTPIEWRF